MQEQSRCGQVRARDAGADADFHVEFFQFFLRFGHHCPSLRIFILACVSQVLRGEHHDGSRFFNEFLIFFGEFLLGRREVIVHVFQARLRHADETVANLQERVVNQMEGCAQFHSRQCRLGASEAEGFSATQVFQCSFGLSQFSLRVAQRFEVLFFQRVGSFGPEFGKVFKNSCHAHVDVALKHGDDECAIRDVPHLSEEHVALLHEFFLLLCEFFLAANDGKDACCDDEDNDDDASEVHGGRYEEGEGESDARCDEPTADDGQHAGDAEHCTFSAPSSVRERRTHGNHESDEGG